MMFIFLHRSTSFLKPLSMAQSLTLNNSAAIYTRSLAKPQSLHSHRTILPIHYNPNSFHTKPISYNICRFSFDPTNKFFENTKNNCCNNLVTEMFNENETKGEAEMTVTAALCIKDGFLMVNGKVVLSDVPLNVAVYPVADGGAFIGASSSVSSSRHVFSLGIFQEYKFTCLFRHKIWWMIPRFGNSGSEIPIETQMLLLEVKEESDVYDDRLSGQYADNTFYVLLLPVLEGQFRATLQGTLTNELQFCVESGDAHIQTSQVFESVFINSGDNPFELIQNSIMILERYKGTFIHINHKKKPAHLDWFGWCTWDAFYQDVNPQGIKDGLESFLEGGCPPKFLIIDDGWQDTMNEFWRDGQPFIEGTQFSTRLIDIKESSKFKGLEGEIPCNGLHEFINFIKEKYNLKLVYVWHALIGYWGGLLPSSEKLQKYNPKMKYPVQSPGNVGNLRDIAMDSIEKYGVGLVDPQKIYDFYNDLHSYLSSHGVDGVKVDVQNLIETLGEGYGGRVALTRQYQEALEESVARNFSENNLISCMCHNSDSIYSSRRSATARASEDFMPREPMFQTLHIASVAFNSLLLGEIVVPDWDMFQSNHYTAEFHGAARALGGCPVYVSDKPGMHDFAILKKIVLPDGSVLRAKYAGRPTRDCLFSDTVMDGKSLLKIWNLNKVSGIVGIFNCQGCGKWSLKDGPEYSSTLSTAPLVLSGHVSPLDIDFLEEVADDSWLGDCAVYAFHTGSLSRLSKDKRVEVSLSTLQCEIFTISPIRVVNETIQFAPIGLIDMYNSGGATESLSYTSEPCKVRVEARGSERFGAYSSKEPTHCTVDGVKEDIIYDEDNGLLVVKLEGECKIRDIHLFY